MAGATRRQAVMGGLAGGALAAAGVAPHRARADERKKLTVGMSGFPVSIEPVLSTQTATRRVVAVTEADGRAAS